MSDIKPIVAAPVKQPVIVVHGGFCAGPDQEFADAWKEEGSKSVVVIPNCYPAPVKVALLPIIFLKGSAGLVDFNVSRGVGTFNGLARASGLPIKLTHPLRYFLIEQKKLMMLVTSLVALNAWLNAWIFIVNLKILNRNVP